MSMPMHSAESPPMTTATSPPMGIPAEHQCPARGKRCDSCEARPGLIESTHIAPLNEGLMTHDMPMSSSPPMGISPDHERQTKGPRRNSCEARPGLIESTHLAPLNEGLMSSEHHSHMAAGPTDVLWSAVCNRNSAL